MQSRYVSQSTSAVLKLLKCKLGPIVEDSGFPLEEIKDDTKPVAHALHKPSHM